MSGPYSPAPPSARSAAARGSEVALSRWSGFFILIAVLALLGGVTAGLAWVDQRNDPDAPALLSAAILLLSVAISGAFFSALLRAAADVVRLLKHIAHLPYHGEL